MLPAAARMRRRAEFTAAVRGGARASASGLVLHLFRSDAAIGSPHVGFVVPRAVGPAVVRNRVRRRLRHLMISRLAALPAGSRLVVRVTPPAASMSSAVLAPQLDRALTRLLGRSAGGAA